MDLVQLTKLFVERAELIARMAEIDEQITAHVLEVGETVSIAGQKATYYKPSVSYDYQAAAEGHPMVSDTTIGLFTTVKEYVSWQKICEHAGIEDIPFTEKPARVAIK